MPEKRNTVEGSPPVTRSLSTCLAASSVLLDYPLGKVWRVGFGVAGVVNTHGSAIEEPEREEAVCGGIL